MARDTSIPGKLNLWDRILQLFGTVITWEWCLVGCTIGRHSWDISQEKCRNGVPVISGWFLTVYKFGNEEDARKMLVSFNEIAAIANKKKGFST